MTSDLWKVKMPQNLRLTAYETLTALRNDWTMNCVIISPGVRALCNILRLSSARHYADTFIKAIGALWRGDPECRARHSRSSGTRTVPRRERAAVDFRYCGDSDIVVRRALAGAAGGHRVATGQRLSLLRAEVFAIHLRQPIR